MKVSLNKTKIVVHVFRRGGILKTSEKWYYRGKPVTVVSEYKYLGSIFTPFLRWGKTNLYQAKQAEKSLVYYYRIFV
jgi:hypothetical protein